MRDIGKLTVALALAANILMPAESSADYIKDCQDHASRLKAQKAAIFIEEQPQGVSEDYVRCVVAEVNKDKGYSSTYYRATNPVFKKDDRLWITVQQ